MFNTALTISCKFWGSHTEPLDSVDRAEGAVTKLCCIHKVDSWPVRVCLSVCLSVPALEASGANMAKIERTGQLQRSKYPKTSPIRDVRSTPHPPGNGAGSILSHLNFTLPPTDFKYSLYGFMNFNSNASNRSGFTKQLPSAPLPCTAGSSMIYTLGSADAKGLLLIMACGL